MLVVLLAIVDFARIYTTVVSVESGAREAADYGTTLGAAKWQVGAPRDGTVAEMRKRACVATSNLPEYVGPDNNCVNPIFEYCVTPDDGVPATTETCGPINDADDCHLSTRLPPSNIPCKVTVTLTYEFRLLVPANIDVLGVTIGVPPTITFERDSTFAMTDIDLSAPTPTPTP